MSNPKTEPIGGTDDNMADIEADPIFCEAYVIKNIPIRLGTKPW